METVNIPSEEDFKKWIKDAIKEELQYLYNQNENTEQNDKNFINRKEAAKLLSISLVTLTDWVKKGLPCYQMGIRIYFIRSEILDHMKQGKRQR